MPLLTTKGAASATGLGFSSSSEPSNFIEDVFSCFLRLSDGTNTQAIVNNIDLSTKGGLVWSKPRVVASENHIWVDSARGLNKYLSSDLTSAQGTMGFPYVFNTNGFTSANGNFWANGVSLVDWTFRKQPKFFDVVTYTGTGSNRTIAHSLGSVPGSIIIKRTDTSADWIVYHRSLGATQYMYLNTLDNADNFINYWNSTAPTSAVFSLGVASAVNASGGTYVAYIFAHDAGGFGLTSTDNVISCGTYLGTGAVGNTITLGYEPQWVMIKKTTGTANGNWFLFDNMRGMPVGSADAYLFANSSAAEASLEYISPTATGFSIQSTVTPINGSGETYIYIAIRRGPMKVPTLGTSVFATATSLLTNPEYISNFPVDMEISTNVTYGGNRNTSSRLLQGTFLLTNSTNAESSGSSQYDFTYMNGWATNAAHDSAYRSWMFRRAPSFFDIVCYTGSLNSYNNLTINHNLGVAPQIIIIKRRSSASSNNNWYCGWNMNSSTYMEAILNESNAGTLYSYPNWFTSAPTASTFEVSYQGGNVNVNGATYVAYLFATCAGVSKVGSYTGTGALQTINCGFTGGARFVLIKRTDSTGDWWTYDSARGITSGNDPYLYLNSTAAEVTGTNYVDTDSTGFKVTAAAPAELNANGGTYIFLAIA